MASASFESSDVELWGQPDIKKPEPLRIIKARANTISGCSTPREVSMPRRGSVGPSNPHGSSPEYPGRSLTIFKRRRARGSVLDGSFERSSDESSTSSKINQAANFHDLPAESNDKTPKAHRPSSRIASVGSFLKSELFRGSSESEINISCPKPVQVNPRGRNETIDPLDMEPFPPFRFGDTEPHQEFSSKTSQKRKFVGKKLVSKAFDSLGNSRSKSVHFIRSNSSKDSLFRQVSLKNLDPPRPISSEESSRNSSRFSFEQDSVLNLDTRFNPAIRADGSPALPNTSFMLYPEVTAIPEIESVGFGDEVSFWVAIVVTGVLRKTIDCDAVPDTLLMSRKLSTSQDETLFENRTYGHLYGVDITLAARKGCVLQTVLQVHDQSRHLHLGQTSLTLAKVKLLVGRRRSSHVRESSKELIAELEGQLGNATTEYLTIGISYKHSAIPTCRNATVAIKGLSYHSTTMRIEAHAVIKRHCSGSSWTCQTSECQDLTSVSNPLLSLIRTHCSLTEAARLISRIAPNPAPFPAGYQRHLDTGHRGQSSSDTLTPTRRKSPGGVLEQRAKLDEFLSTATPKQSLDVTQAAFHDPDGNSSTLTLNPCSNPDPARKIWSDMRKTSRSAGRRDSPAPYGLDIELDDKKSLTSEVEVDAQKEQARLRDLALRNKRSLGADTLRSMAAPSTSMGLGMGRGWGWAPPWW